ncbi:polysaccharide lyase 6 family protein [Paenibacillus sp. J22TS3]|uniref:polysaccharide lyase 6 family protein n=1 Tax=Paenibacillus sp. J22TS3 TaxID=2807192 RepID=UPI001B2521F4|nr:polysaccharide lyase 6 family protein [Paenibacillus sp. J22TS3]GIP23723.1 lyase [Paenibacillus sp. J22TS3]
MNVRQRFISKVVCLGMVIMLLPIHGYAAESVAPLELRNKEESIPWKEANNGLVQVSNSQELLSALKSAKPGQTIVLANGSYTAKEFELINVKGTENQPVLIKAANLGKAVITGKTSFEIRNSSYVTIEGLKFTNSASKGVLLDGSNHIRITRNQFALAATGSESTWLQVSGLNSHHNRIDHNDFGHKSDKNPLIGYEGDGKGNISQHDVIEYNYFHDIGPWVSNGKETIRLGLSKISLSHGYNTIQYNLFENADGEPEMVSVKSSSNTVRYNTFKTSKGGLTSRHGHNNSFYGNFFLGDGKEPEQAGIRVYGNDHKIYNNYMEKLTDYSIILDSGDFDGGSKGNPANPSKDDLKAQWKVYRAMVVNNTIVNSASGITIGSGKEYDPQDSIVANNIVMKSGSVLFNEAATTNTRFEGNIGYGGKLTNKDRKKDEIWNTNPQFMTINGLQKISSSSPAVDYAKGSYVFVKEDLDGELRNKNDAGADEYSNASSFVNHPLTTKEVGPSAP